MRNTRVAGPAVIQAQDPTQIAQQALSASQQLLQQQQPQQQPQSASPQQGPQVNAQSNALIGAPQGNSAAPPQGNNAAPPTLAAKKKWRPWHRKPKGKDLKGQMGAQVNDPKQVVANELGRRQAAQQNTNPAKEYDPDEGSSLQDLAEQSTVFADPIDAVGGAVGGVGDYIGMRADYENDKWNPHREKDDDAKDAHGEYVSSALGTASSGAGVMTSGFTAASGFLGLVGNIRAFSKMSAEQKRSLVGVDMGFQATGNAATGVTGVGQMATSAGGLGAGIASTLDSGNDAAANAATAFGGLGDAVGTLGGTVQLVVSGGRVVIGTIQNLKAMSSGSETKWADTAADSLGMLKGFLSTANSALHVVSAFCSIAGKAAELANALPLVGACVNIAIQFLDILIQLINGIKALVKLVEAVVEQKRMNAAGADEDQQAGATNDAAEKAQHEGNRDVAKRLGNINRKRYRRQILPLTTSCINIMADTLSVGGSVLNICGVATAPAYGAGVAIMAAGYGVTATAGLMKLGTALAGPVQRMVRWQKQSGRDAVDRKSGGAGQAGKLDGMFNAIHDHMPKKLQYDAGKSTSKKDEQYLADTQHLIGMMAGLPDWNNGSDPKVVSQYERTEGMVRATGVRTKELYNARDEAEVTKLFMDAMKTRG